MAGKSKDRWWDESFNPVTGCTPISEGCRNCWAARMVKRFPQLHGADDCDHGCTTPHPRPFSKIKFHPPRLDQPLRWKKPRRVFVCSMGDLFHEDVPGEWVDMVIGATRLTPQHIFMVLTKRPERMWEYFASHPGKQMHRTNMAAQNMVKPARFICPDSSSVWPRHNLWLGVSVCTRKEKPWLDILRKTPAALRYVSFEPILEDMGSIDFTGISWAIIGCESGPGRRLTPAGAMRDVKNQCVAAGIPVFVKQADINGKLVKMPPLDGKVWDEVPG